MHLFKFNEMQINAWVVNTLAKKNLPISRHLDLTIGPITLPCINNATSVCSLFKRSNMRNFNNVSNKGNQEQIKLKRYTKISLPNITFTKAKHF